MLIVKDTDHTVPFSKWWELATAQPEQMPGAHMSFTKEAIVVIYDEDIDEIKEKLPVINQTIADIRQIEDKFPEESIENYFMIDVNLNECSEQELQEMSIFDRDFW